ncbi:MAG: UDP-N-acetylglucosamine--N-acetylmuramyl-(pentapeptide) pyrophosphoryl-undecaprenol N-acetylglucosamine transferase, partial [Candidatus Kerfeldbacteria bacterium]|nr:UDP-N-acetylglucosamine--N-acetylmuramyl-(pentapeptide) pyrophosphoryl-undecaprenol N-acetylglucosamine transferase [Candidatus Kerfeldbacteria bacterium]
MRILVTGGGTGGSVTPLLAVLEVLQSDRTTVLFIGTPSGPERRMCDQANVPFRAIHASKLPRYATWRLLIQPLLFVLSLVEAASAVRAFHPDIILGAGGYVQVPIVFVARVLRVPVVLHQQDVELGLANRLCARHARTMTYVLADAKPRVRCDTVHTGNPIRRAVRAGDARRARAQFHVTAERPVLLIIGGGTGSRQINDAVRTVLPQLTASCDVIHVTGEGKADARGVPSYHPTPFLDDALADVLASAVLVVTRAGMGVLSECAALRKSIVIVPLPESHQEHNAAYVADRGAAAVITASFDDASLGQR